MINNSDLSELPQNFVQFYVPDDKHKPQSEIGRQALVYHYIRGLLMRAGVPLDELKQQTDQIFIRLNNAGLLGGENND